MSEFDPYFFTPSEIEAIEKAYNDFLSRFGVKPDYLYIYDADPTPEPLTSYQGVPVVENKYIKQDTVLAESVYIGGFISVPYGTISSAPICTCGSAKLNHPGHSQWCDINSGTYTK